MSKSRSLLKTLFNLGIGTFAGLHGLNRYITSKADTVRTLKTKDGNFYSWKFGSVFYTKSGKGEKPILLIHDARPYSSSAEWERLVKKLENQYLVYTIDLPGCGRSDKPAIVYTNYLYVQLLSAFIKDVIKQKTRVAATGVSFSFTVMAAFAEPELFAGLYAINPLSLTHLRRIPDTRSKALCRMLQIPVLGTCVYHFLTSRKNMEYLLNEEYFYNPFNVRKKYLDAYYQGAHLKKSNGRFLRASLDGHYLYWNIDRAIRSLKVPVTLIFGEKLPNAKEISKGYLLLIPEARCKWVPKTKMLPHLELPDFFNHLF